MPATASSAELAFAGIAPARGAAGSRRTAESERMPIAQRRIPTDDDETIMRHILCSEGLAGVSG